VRAQGPGTPHVQDAADDDFAKVAARRLKRFLGQHDKDSDEDRALRALREIRARAASSWNAEQVEVTFW
jgi:hypothetical protein